MKVTFIVQLAEGAKPEPQLSVLAKSDAFVPLIVMLEIVRALLPVFVSVIGDGELVPPTTWLENAKEAVEIVNWGEVPVPVKLIV